MDRHDRPSRHNRHRHFVPGVQALESRQLLTFIAPWSTGSLWSGSSASQQSAARAAIVRHEYDTFVGVVKTLELQSRATPEEFRALRDDAREISIAASAANLPRAIARNKAVEVSLQLDRSPLYGWAEGSAWAEISTRLTTNLDSLDTPQPLIEKTLADEKAVAVSAGVDFNEFQAFSDAFSTLRAARRRFRPAPTITSETRLCFTHSTSAGSFAAGECRRSQPRRSFKMSCGPYRPRPVPRRPTSQHSIAMCRSLKASGPHCRAR